MLSITASESAQSAKDYFEHSLCKGDYYLSGSVGLETVGKWHGELANMLGLSGEVTKDEFNALVDNIHPETGEKLTVRNSRKIPGYDFTFNAPKSLSILYSMTDDQRLLDAFRDSVRDAMSHVEEDMETRVRKNNKSENRTTGNLLWGEFIHTAVRPVDGVPDPHLHIHAYAFNATYNAEEQQIKAGKFRNLKRDGNYYEAYFHSVLTNKLSGLGINIEKKGRFWEIANFNDELITKFSNRTQRIEERADELGITSNDAKGKLARTNRESKNYGLSYDELRVEWFSRLTDEERDTIFGSGGGSPPSPPGISKEQAARYAIDHSFERSSVVPERKLKEQALRFSFGSLNPEELKDAFDSDEVIKRQKDGQKLATTRDVLNEEKSMVDFAYGGISMHERLNHDYFIKRDFLSEEQRKAIQHILTSRDRVIAIQGKAGAGKTTLMQEAVEGINEGGRFVYTFAPSSDATDILRDEGFNNSNTVARLLIDDELQKSLENQVIWIDEAGLLSTRDMKAVFDIADKQNARVVLSGDTQQHSSVVRGDAFRILQQEARIQPAYIETIRRQKDETYRQAVMDIVNGEIEEGFQKLDEMNAVVEIDDDEERYKKLAGEYTVTTSSGKSILVVSPTHREGEKVTDAIRQELKETGVLNNKGIAYTSYKNLNFTGAEKQDRHSYYKGQFIQFVQNAKGFKRGDRVEVLAADKDGIYVQQKDGSPALLDYGNEDRFNVYMQKEIELAKGDKIRITQNGLTHDKKRLNNGSLYEVKAIDKRNGKLTLNNGWVVSNDFGNLTHGYVTTSHSSQGKTVDQVIIAQSSDSLPASDLKQFYVSSSRGKSAISIYTDDREQLMDAVREQSTRLSATELLKEQEIQDEKHEFPFLVNRLNFYKETIEGFAKASLEKAQGFYQQLINNNRDHSTEWDR